MITALAQQSYGSGLYESAVMDIPIRAQTFLLTGLMRDTDGNNTANSCTFDVLFSPDGQNWSASYGSGWNGGDDAKNPGSPNPLSFWCSIYSNMTKVKVILTLPQALYIGLNVSFT